MATRRIVTCDVCHIEQDGNEGQVPEGWTYLYTQMHRQVSGKLCQEKGVSYELCDKCGLRARENREQFVVLRSRDGKD
jgi:hypothetical protein